MTEIVQNNLKWAHAALDLAQKEEREATALNLEELKALQAYAKANPAQFQDESLL